ncbi:N-6 DNA methylase [Glutamicibacter arilaitensis]|uniref:N-6 DNA methylase n=1 Tax=Glutamicibacter arilaitensis TaxID=256701 RepID=UPI003FD45E96
MSNMKEIIKLLKQNSGAKNLGEVFKDFVHLGAISYCNSANRDGWQKREDQYLQIIGQYNKEQVHRFVEVLALFTCEMTREPRDILGELYMSLELGSKDLGQCFTPWHVAQLMATLTDMRSITEVIETRGYATLSEPCSGAGALAIAMVEDLRKNGVNPQQQIHLTAEDINRTAVHMTYMQLSILGIPAVVHHRDTLSMETFESWPTPMHILGGWNSRLRTKELEPALQTA